jgi:transcriptional regulator with GAF, ATPase, and Fis domain
VRERILQTFPSLDQSVPLVDRLVLLHSRMRAVVPSVERVAFAVHHSSNDLLSTYVSHSASGTVQPFSDQRLAAIPRLARLAERRCCSVVHDIAAELSPQSDHTRWLLDQGWRSSYTLPLFWGEELLGFLFLNAFDPAVFTPPALQHLQPHVELLA